MDREEIIEMLPKAVEALQDSLIDECRSAMISGMGDVIDGIGTSCEYEMEDGTIITFKLEVKLGSDDEEDDDDA